ncbi:MAG: lytic polysaccharide monooxygenase, partial [Bacteroidota bacterium]
MLIASFQFVLAHGTVTYPPSRIWICFRENPENPDTPACIDAVASHGTQPLYDWNEINQREVDGNHLAFVPDSTLASGGRPDKYGGMDQVRSDWVATPVSPGPTAIIWSITAPHAAAYYDVFITKASWTPDQPLTWDNLELLVRTGPRPLETEVNIPVTLPQRTGRHVIYSVWQRSLSPEAFYSASDVDFGGGTTSVNPGNPNGYFSFTHIGPNPFQEINKVSYSMTKGDIVSLKVYDISGKEIATLVDEFQEPGEY